MAATAGSAGAGPRGRHVELHVGAGAEGEARHGHAGVFAVAHELGLLQVGVALDLEHRRQLLA